ncbi:MAG: phosphatidate cytidylyltransferase [Candidatus Dormibacteria bacterium]
MRLVVRTASGVALLAVVLLALYLGPAALATLVAVVMGVGVFEYWQLWQGKPGRPSLVVLVPLAAFFLFRFAYSELPVAVLGLLAGSLVGLTLTIVRSSSEKPLASWALAFGGSVWIGYLSGCFLLLYAAAGSRDRGMALVLLTVGISVLSDTAAYLVGSAIGRHPFFPRISPKKTWEGAIAGWVVPTLVAGTLLPHVLPKLGLPVAFAIAAAASASAIAGDLAESQLKREVGVKDSGRLIPGHGGVLDRVDSLLFVGAVVYSLLGVAHAF